MHPDHSSDDNVDDSSGIVLQHCSDGLNPPVPNALRDELQETVCPIFQKEQARHSPRTYLQPVGEPTLALLDREHKTFRLD
ncbi:hypothetical protein D3C76_1721950 [compost metagenome]